MGLSREIELQMEFKLKINPGLEARKFLEARVATLRSAKVEEGLARLKEDLSHIFTGRYDKLKKDTRFVKGFLDKQQDLRGEQTILGETLIRAFSILDREYEKKLSESGKGESRTEVNHEYFNEKLKALEDIFAGDISVFEHMLVTMFLRHSYQPEKLKEENLKKVKERFREFVQERERLLRFFYCLDEFDRLNQLRAEIDQEKKSSLSEVLENEIQREGTNAGIERQIIICHKLEHLARNLIGVSEGHDPLNGIKRVVDEVYSVEGNQNLAKGLLEKFRKYYEIEFEVCRDALVYKRIVHLNSGSKEARKNRKKWLESMSYYEVDRLVNLLEIKEESWANLSQDQKARRELFQSLRKKLDEDNAEQEDVSKRRNTLEEGDMNLLVMRLDNVSQLEDQITAVGQRLEEYRRQNNMDDQDTIYSYNDNIKHLSECLYFYLELSMLKNPDLGVQGKELLLELRKQMDELDSRLKAEMAGTAEGPAGDSTAETAPDQAATPAQEAAPGSESRLLEKQEIDEEKDPEKRAAQGAEQLKDLPDSAKIKPLKELACFGSLGDLPQILPLYQYSSAFLHKLARNAVIKIILRELKEEEDRGRMGVQQKKKLIELMAALDNKYSYLKEMEISDPKTRQKIYDILIREDKDFTAQSLTEIIVDTDEKVRATAVKLIAGMLQQKESGLLIRLLGDSDPRVRANVIESMEETGDRHVLGILMKYKFDKDSRVRANAIKAIWNFGHRDVADSLEEMLMDFDPKARASATWAIGEIGHNQPELKNLLHAVTNDDDEMVKHNLELAMKKIAGREEGLRVLVADNDEKLCQKISRGLDADGYETKVVYNGKDALSAAEKHKPHAILLDLRMPVLNGLEALKALREKEETRETPVIVFCDFNSSALIKQAQKAGADSYLVKPFSYEEVKQKLQTYI